jgi:hypothetical protein
MKLNTEYHRSIRITAKRFSTEDFSVLSALFGVETKGGKDDRKENRQSEPLLW